MTVENQDANGKNAWAFAHLKEAALYFELVRIPVSCLLGDDLAEVEALLSVPHKKDPDFPAEIVAPGLVVAPQVLTDIFCATIEGMWDQSGKSLQLSVQPDDPLYRWHRALVTHLLAASVGLAGSGVWVTPNDMRMGLDLSADPLVSLTEINLIDATKLSWEQIIEIRADKERTRKIRRLRLFLMKEHKGHSLSQIEDDLLQRIEDYQDTARKVGADTREGTVSMFLTKEVYASAVASLSAASLGQPLIAAAATAPIVLQIGKAALEFRKQRRAAIFEASQNPIGFLYDLKKKTKAKRHIGPL